jgi:preprotein translocase subunit SecD
MSTKETLKLALISFIFSLSVLVILPRIEIGVNSRLLKIDSYIGGYSLTIFGKTLDLSDFKKSSDFGGTQRITFTIGKDGDADIEATSQLVKQITEQRLISEGYLEYSVYIQKTDGKYNLVVEVPKYVDTAKLAGLLYGTGNLAFKILKDPTNWRSQDLNKLARTYEAWVPTDISRADVSNLIVSKDSTGQDQLQVVLTPQGKTNFNQLAKANVNNPVAFFINDQDTPILIPVIDPSLAGDTLVDPTLTGYFPEGFLSTFLTQFKNGPLPVKLALPELSDSSPKYGANALGGFGLALLAGFGVFFVLSIVLFRARGLTLFISALLSTSLLLAMTKLFSISVSLALIAGILVTFLLFVEKGYGTLRKLRSEESEDKPFGYAVEKVLSDDGSVLKYLVALLFFSMLVVSKFMNGDISSFIYSVLVGSLCLLYFYFVFGFFLRTSKGGRK